MKIKNNFVKCKNSIRPSKGWSKISPKRGNQRQELYAKCGDSCFLLPNELKFPICSNKNDCRINCSGLNAANTRAGQYKYSDVQKKAKKLYYENCK